MTARTNRLQEERERSRLTQQEVGKLLDIDHTTVAHHEAGRGLTDEMVKRYAEVYKVETHELFFKIDADSDA